MTYEYTCDQHGAVDVTKSVIYIDNPEPCPLCGVVMTRKFVPSRVHFSKTKVEHAEYNPGLGIVTKSRRHRDEVAKERGLIEIGNESVDKIESNLAKERETRSNEGYTQAFEEIRERIQTPSGVEDLTHGNFEGDTT